MKIYLVGGAVRDELLGLSVKERDWVVVGATPDQMLAQGFEQVGKSFPVFIHPQTKEEYALARKERKISAGYYGFEFDTSNKVTLEEDLSRRDLTMNAIAKDASGKLIDPYHGQRDLQNRVLRHVSSAFVEDPVRVLRVARFAARFASLGFTVAEQTIELMTQMAQQGELQYLIPERVFKELRQALSEKTPVAFIQTLRQANALKSILPEIDALYGVPQNPIHHPEIDVGIHTEKVLEQAAKLSDSPQVRFAALLHDLGKAATAQDLWPEHKNHEEHSAKRVKQLCKRLKVPSDYESLAWSVARFHGQAYRSIKSGAQAVLQLLESCDAFRRPERFEQFLIACEADFRGRLGFEEQAYHTGKILKRALKAAEAVDIKSIISTIASNDGQAVKRAIHEARLNAITDLGSDL